MDWENHLDKKSDQKFKETVKIDGMEDAACEQKTTSERANFYSNTFFSLYFKIRMKKNYAAKPLDFRSTSCFGMTKMITPICQNLENV